MSVYKALRGDSSVQFVETARKLAVHTRKCCLKMPKRYTFYGAQELSALADTVYNEVKMANSVFPGNQHEAQLRRDHLIEANAMRLSVSSELWQTFSSKILKSCAGSIILSRSGLPSSVRRLS